jgi:hypothetical protein
LGLKYFESFIFDEEIVIGGAGESRVTKRVEKKYRFEGVQNLVRKEKR